jgi:hypothetical protein
MDVKELNKYLSIIQRKYLKSRLNISFLYNKHNEFDGDFFEIAKYFFQKK